MQLYRGGERFDSLGGLQALKAFCLRSMRRQGHSNPLRRPRGVLLIGVPGSGKSQLCKCLGPETGRPTLILDIYLRLFELDPEQSRPRDDQWTGAEIRACCRLAALLDVPLSAAAQNVVPVAVTAGESVERLRTWATGRCLDAEAGGIYGRGKSADGPPRRKVRRDPSSN